MSISYTPNQPLVYYRVHLFSYQDNNKSCQKVRGQRLIP